MTHRTNLVAALMAATAMTSCGGGGGTGASSTPVNESDPQTAQAAEAASPPIPATLPNASTALVTSVPAATYEPGSAKAAAFSTINAERSRCGFGLLAQSPELDQAVKAHVNYLALNSEVVHAETIGKPGFTGVRPWDRAIPAGYKSDQVSEGIASMATNDGERAIRLLLSAPYHAVTLLWGAKDFGIYSAPVNDSIAFVANLGLGPNTNPQDTGAVNHYPCAGTTGAQAYAQGEIPSPFPSEPNPAWGQPIIVKGTSSLRVTGVSLIGPEGEIKIKAVYGAGQAIDPNGYCREGWACVIPEPLRAGATYEVYLTWTDSNGSGASRFSFSTGER